MSFTSYFDFSGGLNNNKNSNEIEKNELCYCNNVVPSSNGGFLVRGGTTFLFDSFQNSNIYQYIQWKDDKSTRHLFLKDYLYNQKSYFMLYEYFEENNSITAVMEPDMPLYRNYLSYFFYKDKIFFSDGICIYEYGGADVYRYSGSAALKHNQIILATGMADDILTTTKLNSFSLLDTFINNPASFGTNPTDENYIYKAIEGDTHIGNFMNYDFNNGKFEKIGKLNEYYKYKPYDTQFYDLKVTNFLDTDVFEKVYSFERKARVVYEINSYNYTGYSAARCRHMVYYPKSGKYFAVGDSLNPNLIYYSELNNPASWSFVELMYKGLKSGVATNICVMGENVLVSFENGWFAYNSENELGDAWKFLPINVGAVSGCNIVHTPNSVTFLAKDGIYCMKSNITKYEEIFNISSDLFYCITDNKVFDIIKSIKNMSACRLAYCKGKLYFAYNDESSNGINDKILVYDWDKKSFTIFSGIIVFDFQVLDNDTLYIASKNFILRLDENLNCDLDVLNENEISYKPISFKAVTKPFALDNSLFNEKIVNKFYISYKQSNDNSENDLNINVSLISDYENKIFEANLKQSLIWKRSFNKSFGFSENCVLCCDVNKKGTTHQIEISGDKMECPIIINGFGFSYKKLDIEGVSNSNEFLIDERYYD